MIASAFFLGAMAMVILMWLSARPVPVWSPLFGSAPVNPRLMEYLSRVAPTRSAVSAPSWSATKVSMGPKKRTHELQRHLK